MIGVHRALVDFSRTRVLAGAATADPGGPGPGERALGASTTVWARTPSGDVQVAAAIVAARMDAFQAIVLGIVQGLTEFLPVSSTGHLRIVPAFLGWEDPGAAFTAVTQLGTLAAVLVYFREDLWRITTTWCAACASLSCAGSSTPGWAGTSGSARSRSPSSASSSRTRSRTAPARCT